MRPIRLSLLFIVMAAAAAPAWAAEIEGCHPSSGAPGDLIYVQGSRFASQPAVTLGGLRAEVVRSTSGALLCRVPAGLEEGRVELRVDGAPAPGDFHAQAAGTPVVHGLSADAGTRGQAVFVHGRRLHQSRIAFVDSLGRTAATVGAVGGRRALVFLVPETLDPGSYDVVFTNGDGLASGTCSPGLDVVIEQPPELGAIHPAAAVVFRSATPGQRIRCLGTDLGPMGPCRVHWIDRHGVQQESAGYSNGYDSVTTSVPASLIAGEPHEVTIELRSGARTPSVSWTPAKYDQPFDAELDPPAGPAGSYVALRCAGLYGSAAEVQAELSSAQGIVAADLVFGHPGGLGTGSAWVLRIPVDLAEGDYELAFRVGRQTLPPMTYRVGEQPLVVTCLWPTRPHGDGTDLPTLIHGAGFGSAAADDDLRVVWTNGERTREGTVVFRSDRWIRLLPFSGNPDAPRRERWSVYVLRGRGTATRAVKAGAVYFGGW